MTMAVVSGWVGVPPGYINTSLSNHSSYCLRNGYEYVHFGDSQSRELLGSQINWGRCEYWVKIKAVLDCLGRGYDGVFYTDMDSLFMRKEFSLQDLVNDDKDILFSGDLFGPANSGHYFVRNTSKARIFLQEWLTFFGVPGSKLTTTDQDESGCIGDNLALTLLLTLGSYTHGCINQENLDAVDGWPRNPNRRYKNYPKKFAALDPARIARLQTELISPRWRDVVGIVKTRRMNAVPAEVLKHGWFREAGVDAIRTIYRWGDPILHAVMGTKRLLPWYAKFVTR